MRGRTDIWSDATRNQTATAGPGMELLLMLLMSPLVRFPSPELTLVEASPGCYHSDAVDEVAAAGDDSGVPRDPVSLPSRLHR